MFEKDLGNMEENPHWLLPRLHHHDLAGFHSKETIDLAGNSSNRENLANVSSESNLLVLHLLPPLLGAALPPPVHAAHPLRPSLLLDWRQLKGEILSHRLVFLQIKRLWGEQQCFHHARHCRGSLTSHGGGKEGNLKRMLHILISKNNQCFVTFHPA